ncbi:MAG TPA: hypothetical protein VG937_03770 [Polyangiaceae bacterium]|nr:hypothetical protein [Polyangiaceae bacterium]
MPSASDSNARLDAIIDGRLALDDYERFLARSSSTDDYLFSEARARFEARDEDLLRAPADLRVVGSTRNDEVEIGSVSFGGRIGLAGLSRATVERLLPLIDGKRSYSELRELAGSDRGALDRLVEGALGSLLFAPEAVAALEARISGAELVRFVGTPYEIVRAYWENMGDVREAARISLPGSESATDFRRELQRLHVVALLGASLTNFYRPASKITQTGIRPGALYTSETKTVDGPHGTLFVSGPRIGVTLVGGEHYHALLYAEDPGALAPARSLSDDDGLDWGRVATGRAASDARDATWFCPPRPITPEHWEKLFSSYRAARTERDEPERATLQLARFHYRFVRLHPFRCANQSLSMNLVNLALSESHGAGMPHLLLDQLALRLNERAYSRVFARAARAHAFQGPAGERWAKLRQLKVQAYALIERLKNAKDIDQARAFAAADPVAANAALIDPSSG